MIPIIAVSFVVLLLLGIPVAFVIGVAGFIGLWWSGEYPLTVIVKQTFEGVDSFVLLAIPLFILAGAFMETGGIAVRLVRLAQVLVGWIRGGLSMAVVVAEYIFSGISGSTVADVSAIGSTMIPPMLRAGYRPEQAVAVVSAASAMGILVPPCILMIVIGSVANVSVAALFAAGFLPAVVLALAIMAYIWYDAGRSGIEARARASWGDIGRAFVDAMIPLGLPAIIFGGILGGVVTPTEAAVLDTCERAMPYVVGKRVAPPDGSSVSFEVTSCSTSPSAMIAEASDRMPSTSNEPSSTMILKARLNRKSPTSTEDLLPQTALAVARPRRKSLASTTSSCSKVAVWMNSTAAASATWRSPR